jgi:hypothetical protein
MHSGRKQNQTHINTVDTLETPVWGKPAKEGFLLEASEENNYSSKIQFLTAQKSSTS